MAQQVKKHSNIWILSNKVFGSVVSGHDSNRHAVSLSSHFICWPFHIPSTPLIRVLQGLSMFNVNAQETGQLGWVILRWPLNSCTESTLRKLPATFNGSSFHISGYCCGFRVGCWVYDFPWHYAVHTAGPWAVPGIWSCFMTSCPRAREENCPFPVRTVQATWTLSSLVD